MHMKNIKNIVLFSIFIFVAQVSSYDYAWDGLLTPAAGVIVKGAKEIIKDNLPVVATVVEGAGQDIKQTAEVLERATTNAGLNTTKYVFEKLEGYASSAKDAVIAAKGAAIAVATSPVTTFVAGVTVGVYAGDKLYRYNNPTSYQILQAEQAKLVAAKARLESAIMSREKELLAVEKELKESLIANIAAPRNAAGVPIPCQILVCKLAMMAGYEHVEKILINFNNHAPQIRSKL